MDRVYIISLLIAREYQLTAERGETPDRETVRQALSLSPEAFNTLLCLAENLNPLRLDAPADTDPDSAALGDLTAGSEDPVEEVLERMERETGKTILWDAVKTLPEDQSTVISDVYRDGMSEAEAAVYENLPPKTVRKLKDSALRSLRQGRRFDMCVRSAELLKYSCTSSTAYAGSYSQFVRNRLSSVERVALRRETLSQRMSDALDFSPFRDLDD